MIFGPQVMFGTKRPSITSRCKYSAPASWTLRICSAIRAKSADSNDGARIVMFSSFMTQDGSGILRRSRPLPGGRHCGRRIDEASSRRLRTEDAHDEHYAVIDPSLPHHHRD